MRLLTIGFTRKSAEQFFAALRHAGVRRVIDIRLNNRSNLAGFSKAQDLPFLLRAVDNIAYVHEPLLAPTRQLLDDYRKKRVSWKEYQRIFLPLIQSRRGELVLSRDLFEDACLLCSEHLPDRYHRRLVAEYLRQRWGDIGIVHLT